MDKEIKFTKTNFLNHETLHYEFKTTETGTRSMNLSMPLFDNNLEKYNEWKIKIKEEVLNYFELV